MKTLKFTHTYLNCRFRNSIFELVDHSYNRAKKTILIYFYFNYNDRISLGLYAIVAGSAETSANYPIDNEVSLETPSLRHRLEQLQQRQQELTKPTSTNNIHKLMTDKDPLWGGR